MAAILTIPISPSKDRMPCSVKPAGELSLTIRLAGGQRLRGAHCRFQFKQRSELFICAHNETLCVAMFAAIQIVSHLSEVFFKCEQRIPPMDKELDKERPVLNQPQSGRNAGLKIHLYAR